MSALRDRINKHQSILSQYNDNNTENQIQPLLHFVLILCANKNFKGADEILLHLIESSSFQNYEKLSSIWILRSEIAEQTGDLQKAAQLFQEAAVKYEAQVCHLHQYPILKNTQNQKNIQ